MKKQLLRFGTALCLSWLCGLSVCYAFVDVPLDMYCYSPVEWAVGENIANGYGDEFHPKETCIKKHALTFLWRTFVKRWDLDRYQGGSDFEQAVQWAIRTGLEEEGFNPDNKCTRAEFLTYLYILSDRPDVAQEDIDKVVNNFQDVFQTSDFLLPVAWGVKNNITQGSGDSFNPDVYCSRGHIMTFLQRYAVMANLL